ncbi:MAG: hypothetical protein QM820_48505 [Minicystis sp.]
MPLQLSSTPLHVSACGALLHVVLPPPGRQVPGGTVVVPGVHVRTPAQ